MEARISRTLVLIAIAIAALAGWFGLRAVQDSQSPVPAKAQLAAPAGSRESDQQPTSARPTQGLAGQAASGAELTPNQILEASATFAAAVREARIRYGDSDPRVMEMMNLAKLICSSDPDPTRALDRDRPDPSRSWAVARLATLCDDLAFGKFTGEIPRSAGEVLIETKRRSGAASANEEAMAVLREADDFSSLFAAGQVLLETRGMPLEKILGASSSAYGDGDLLDAWSVAVQLAGCRAQGGCGPNSIPTATLCASSGCPPTTDFEQAARTELSPAQFQAANAFAAWLQSQRPARR